MIDKVLKTIEQYNMFDKGDKVIIAVSGGPDSMCLLHILYSLKDNLGIDLVAAHLNHCLRGEEADKDEAYVQEFCKGRNIEFYSKRVDIQRKAREESVSCETAGREARYEFFHELQDKLKAQKIAVAHNANDQAETVIMRIMRGTGLSGLSGIKPVRDKVIVRPIISLSRNEIEKYCEENNIKSRIDKTNLESIYSRNKIRLELIPYIEENFNEDIINTLNRFSYIVSKDNDFLEQMAGVKYEKYCYNEYGKVIIDKKLFEEHEAICTRVIRKALFNIKGDLHNLDMKHIYDIMEIQKKPTGKQVTLPQDIIVSNSYNHIHIYIKEKLCLKNKEEVNIQMGKEHYIEELNSHLSCEILDFKNGKDIKSNNFTKYFDLHKIKGNIIIRYRRDGDRFTPLGMKGSKKLKDMFIDLKIPKEERDRIPLICFGEDIAWIIGYRVSEKFKVDKDTKQILKIAFKRGEKNNEKYE